MISLKQNGSSLESSLFFFHSRVMGILWKESQRKAFRAAGIFLFKQVSVVLHRRTDPFNKETAQSNCATLLSFWWLDSLQLFIPWYSEFIDKHTNRCMKNWKYETCKIYFKKLAENIIFEFNDKAIEIYVQFWKEYYWIGTIRCSLAGPPHFRVDSLLEIPPILIIDMSVS